MSVVRVAAVKVEHMNVRFTATRVSGHEIPSFILLSPSVHMDPRAATTLPRRPKPVDLLRHFVWHDTAAQAPSWSLPALEGQPGALGFHRGMQASNLTHEVKPRHDCDAAGACAAAVIRRYLGRRRCPTRKRPLVRPGAHTSCPFRLSARCLLRQRPTCHVNGAASAEASSLSAARVGQVLTSKAEHSRKAEFLRSSLSALAREAKVFTRSSDPRVDV
ncbi:hypothetical protein C8Q73DRAFT_74161 [Cubamyces lactineus]|nr:hypothetical protein C8Q73DRAFT_74161 [Cubamyces lactineus]